MRKCFVFLCLFLVGTKMYSNDISLGSSKSDSKDRIVIYLAQSNDVGNHITQYNSLISELQARFMNHYQVVDQSDITQAMIDRVFEYQETGRVDDNNLIEPGKQIQAEYLCYIYVRKGADGRGNMCDVKVLKVKESVLHLRPKSFPLLAMTDEKLEDLGRRIANYVLNKDVVKYVDGYNFVENVCGLDLQMIYVENDKKNYFISAYEITEYQWDLIMSGSAATTKRKDMPKSNVSWGDARDFCIELSRMTGYQYSLPTSEQWFFAAKGGQKETSSYSYAGEDNIEKVAWYKYNSSMKVKPVGILAPNKLGLYDMSGNLWEWCDDSVKNGKEKIIRGGSYESRAQECEIGTSFSVDPYEQKRSYGFRVVLDVKY